MGRRVDRNRMGHLSTGLRVSCCASKLSFTPHWAVQVWVSMCRAGSCNNWVHRKWPLLCYKHKRCVGTWKSVFCSAILCMYHWWCEVIASILCFELSATPGKMAPSRDVSVNDGAEGEMKRRMPKRNQVASIYVWLQDAEKPIASWKFWTQFF